jgi:AP-2 complex subunit mu-1
LFQKLRILKSYLGDDFNDETLKGHFTLIYELFDETMDYGYPQNCAVDVLKLYINQGIIDICGMVKQMMTGVFNFSI